MVLAADEALPSASPPALAANAPDSSPPASLGPAPASLGPVPASLEASLPPFEPALASLEPAAVLPEPDFLVGDWELQVVPWNKLRLNGGSSHSIPTAGPQDADGVPMRPLGPGGRLVYNPTVVAQQGMKRLDSYVQTGERAHLRYARKYADVLDKLARGNRYRRWQPHLYDLGVHEAGWVNANSHGLVLSFLSRYHIVTGAPRRLEAASLLMAALQQRRENNRWISLVTNGGYLWFEHWPEGRFDHTLNAHINALFGVYDYWLATGSSVAEQYFLGGARTVRDKLYRFRRKGDLSRYSLSAAEGSLHYHETHIDQLRTLALMTGDRWFAKQARLFERDERIWRAQNRGGGR